MGRHTDPAAIGSRRATVLTLTASALLVAGGLAILRSAGDLRIGPPTPGPSATTPGSLDGTTEPGWPLPTPSTTTTTTTATPSPTTTSAAITTPPAGSPAGTAAPGPTRTPTATTSADAGKPAPPRNGLRQQVVELVNAERSRAGCADVSTDDALSLAAQRHSDDMATRDYFSHTSPDGTTFAERIRAAGYDGGAVAENIAAGQRSAKAVMASWMASPGHRANILNCTYRDIGVGYATGGTYGTYWTQTFGG